MNTFRPYAFLLFAVIWGNTVFATPEVFTLWSGALFAQYHRPGADELFGTADDEILYRPSAFRSQPPNYEGRLSGRVNFASDQATTIYGSVTVDFDPLAPAFFPAGSWDDITRQPSRLGNGIRLWAGPTTNSQSFNPTTVAGFSSDPAATFNLDYTDIDPNHPPPNVDVNNLVLTGLVSRVNAPFAATGNTYIDNVLIPNLPPGAQSLLFINLAGTRNGNPIRFVFVGLIVSPSEQADLELTKGSDAAGPLSPGELATYTLEVTNNGPAHASGVVVTDFLPEDVAYVSDTCGAGPPTPGGGPPGDVRVLSWNVGALSNGAMTSCDVVVDVSATANCEQLNGATALADQLDPELSDNHDGSVVPVLVTTPDGLTQATDISGSLFPADGDCVACGGGSQTMADNFNVPKPCTLTGITVFGGYTNNAPPPGGDQFVVEVFEDFRPAPPEHIPGVPDSKLDAGLRSREISPPVVRTTTGQLLSGYFTEYQYDISLVNPVALDAGVYWVAVRGSASPGEDFFMVTAFSDPLGRSLTNLASSGGVYKGQWLVADLNLALEVHCPYIFADGFESGDTFSWSKIVP